MLIALDARMLGAHPHGLARYAFSLADAMAAQAPSWRFTLLGDSPLIREVAARHENLDFVPVRSRPFSPSEQWEIPRVLARLRPRLFHALSAAVPMRIPVPFVVTVPDLIPLAFPGSGGLKHRLYFRHYLPRALARAARLLAFSEAVREDLATRLGIDDRRVAVAPLGVEPHFHAEPASPEERDDVARRVPLPYLLTVGNPRPHKNLGLAVRAFEALVEAGRAAGLTLVVLSSRGDELEARVEASPVRDRIVRLEQVPEAFLPALYRHCETFFYPSLYEGFGFPILEAMACGAVVVTSRSTSLAEVAGEGAMTVDAHDFPQVVATLEKALRDEQARERFREAGPRHASAYTWERCAALTLEAYRSALALD